MDKKDLLLYGVTDQRHLKMPFLQAVEEALKGGVTMLQLREKTLSDEDLYDLAKPIQALCKDYQVPFILDDRVGLAMKLDADGVHVGQEDMDPREVREKIGPEKILGVSAHSLEEARAAQEAGADYLGVGAAFPTPTKDKVSYRQLEEYPVIAQGVHIPIVAIGGINLDNMEVFKGMGLAGVSIVRGIFAQEDVEGATRKLAAKAQEIFHD